MANLNDVVDTISGNVEWLDSHGEVEDFINRFMVGSDEQQEHLRSKFRAGYCYYFAHMLQLAFSRGLICWTAPFGHFVWLDTQVPYDKVTIDLVRKSKAYDIEGLYRIEDVETFYLIPEQFLGDHVKDFLHTIEGDKHHATKDECIAIVKDYCNKTGEKYDDHIEFWFE